MVGWTGEPLGLPPSVLEPPENDAISVDLWGPIWYLRDPMFFFQMGDFQK